ncbi:hypothetical protein PR202_gb21853 [Eleusine coracana subsp. coracana]|uniref:ATP synthase mitochondrial F1 complex assembly factor 2 n=1 Tax=Eleusine coracana subsp. coracana TaxID=191504 RepID=A0AAV5FES6_ELECO|nr:hypothetical protein PR202_gb21853 [Eleusine coracana subsp. coracana]
MATLAARRLLPRWVAGGGRCRLLGTAAEASTGGEDAGGGGDAIYLKKPAAAAAVSTRDETSVAMPVSFMSGSVVGKRFYRDATVRRADDGNGWTVMLDYRTLKSPAKRPLKLSSRALAMAIAAEWEYQVLIPSLTSNESDGIRPFTMPLMKLACTALERVPQEKIDPILDWVNTEFGFKPVVYTTFFGGKQEEGLTMAVEAVLKKTTDCELASIDAMAAAAHSLVDRWGLVEGGHDVDIADLKVQMSSAVVFLGLSRGM